MVTTNPEAKRLNISDADSFTVDMISNLPDTILSQILSLLPSTKEAVRTSILSKRWKYVWNFVDKILFKNWKNPGLTIENENVLFGQFVSNVLKLQQGNIKELTLACYRGHESNEFDFTSCIDTAMARGVERLDVTTGFRFKFPVSIFSCKTLIDLKIHSLYGLTMDVPGAPILPCLKKLDVPFMGSDTESFKQMVSCCSSLEHLIVNDYDYDTLIEILSSSIKRLELCFPYPGGSGKMVLLGVPSLEFLKIYCRSPPELIVETELSSLIEADICLCQPKHSPSVNVQQLCDSVVRLIHPLSNVKILRLGCECTKFLDSIGHDWFPNLTKLDIVSNFFEWRLLVSLMESSINLQAITLKKTLKKASPLPELKLAWEDPKKVPTCLSSSIRKISLRGCSEDELPMVEYVLRNAHIMERMDMHCANMDMQCANDMLQKIQKFHRACERCEVSVLE